MMSLQDLQQKNPKLLNHTISFLPSAVDSHTLPIVLSLTVSAAKDMDHHFPVMVQINLLAVVHEYGIVICMYAGLPSSKGPPQGPSHQGEAWYTQFVHAQINFL